MIDTTSIDRQLHGRQTQPESLQKHIKSMREEWAWLTGIDKDSHIYIEHLQQTRRCLNKYTDNKLIEDWQRKWTK